MGDWMYERALVRIAERGGNSALKRKSTWRQIIAELGELTSAEETAEARAKSYAARLRWEQAQRDHAEAAEAAAMFEADKDDGVVTPLRPRLSESVDGFDLDAEWPDYDEVGD